MDTRRVTLRVLRALLGIALGAGLFAAAGLVGFVGLWTYAGFKSPGDPVRGVLVLTGAVCIFATGGMALAWALGADSPRFIRRVGSVFAAIAVAVTIWVTAAN